MEKVEKLCNLFGINYSEYIKLQNIGGHKKYHLEGNALTHSIMVYDAMHKMFPGNSTMQLVALLHDVGKIYTSIQLSEDDWEYPDHSTCGAFRGILCKFIAQDRLKFKEIQWLIRNHIKPLFWKQKGINADPTTGLDGKICNLSNLRWLAVADLKGSITANPQENEELIDWLSNLEL